jgi:hypothetical protein
MNLNPYESPTVLHSDSIQPSANQNLVGKVGFYLSLTGASGAVGAGLPLVGIVAALLTFLSLPGLVISIVGICFQPRRLAAWGVALETFGSFNIPTMYFALSR